MLIFKFEKRILLKYSLAFGLLAFLLLPLWWPKQQSLQKSDIEQHLKPLPSWYDGKMWWPQQLKRIEKIYDLSQWNSGQMQVVIYSTQQTEKIEAILNSAWQEVERLDLVINEYRPDSEAGKLRLGLEQGVTPQFVSHELFQLLKFAQTISQNTRGAFDITVSPLIQLWKKCGKENRLPTQEELDNIAHEIGWQHLNLSQNLQVSLQGTNRTSINLGAYSKGYAIDRVVELLQQRGIESGMVNMGGDLRCFGFHIWKIGVQDPQIQDALAPESAIGILQIKNLAVATSGHYRRYTEIQGKRYSHIIDPNTLYPVEMNIVSVTVLGNSAMQADAYATAFCILPITESLKIARQQQIHIAIMTHDSTGYHIDETPNFDNFWYEKPIWSHDK